MKILAVVGVSGVGKTTMLRRLSERLPIIHLEASALIRAEQARLGSATSTSEQLRIGPVLNNQELLVSGFREAVRECDGTILFDGHVLIDAGDQIIEIPDAVFAALRCDHIVVVTDDPSEIVERRTADLSRSRPARTVMEIEDQQRQVVIVATRIAESLGIPCTVIRAAQRNMLEEAVAR